MMWVDLNKTTAAVKNNVIERERIRNVDSLHVHSTAQLYRRRMYQICRQFVCTLYSQIIQKDNVLDKQIVCMYTVHCTARLYRKRMYQICRQFVCTLYSSIIQKQNVLDMQIVCMHTVQLDYIERECTRYVDSLYVHCTA